jgi:PAS domain S-box-containing protein
MSTNGGRETAYRELRESEELHRATLSSISDAVFLTDDDGTFTFVCPNVDVLLGYTPDEVFALENVAGLLRKNLFERSELRARGEIRNIECDIATKSGERRTVLVHIKQVAIKKGTTLYCCRDVTELKAAEDELRHVRAELAHASRLALVGELVASITHEVHQPLTAIISNATAGLHMMAKLPQDDHAIEMRELLTDIVAGGRLAADVIEHLRALARKRPLMLQAVDINELVTDTLKFVGGDARRRHVTLRAELEPTLPNVQADRVCLQHVLLSLTLNAMEAMEHVEPDKRNVLLRTQHGDHAVEIAVTDAGDGIPDEHLPRMFEAFFTTKQAGLGLGLAIAQSIVDAHNGRIVAENDESRGATFRVTLPTMASA